MPGTRTGLYPPLAAALFGLGTFSVIYPVLVKVFAPARVLAPHHLAFFVAGILLLAASRLCWRMGRR